MPEEQSSAAVHQWLRLSTQISLRLSTEQLHSVSHLASLNAGMVETHEAQRSAENHADLARTVAPLGALRLSIHIQFLIE